MSKLVSIITPAYRAEKTIVATVKSVLAQTYPHWELLIVSDDQKNYGEFLAQKGINDNRIRHYMTDGIGRGSSMGRNIGLDQARSDYIALLDADDWFKPQKLEKIVPLLEKYDLISNTINLVNAQKKLLQQAGSQVKTGVYPFSAFKFINFSSNACIVFNKKKLPHSFDLTFKNLEDVIFVMEAGQFIEKFYHISEPLHDYLQQPNSDSKKAGAGENYVRIKHILLNRLEQGYYKMLSPKNHKAIIEFLKISLHVEQEVLDRAKIGESVRFEEILTKQIQHYQHYFR